MASQVYSDDGTGPRGMFRFLVAPGDANWGGKAHGGTVTRWIDEVVSTCAAGWIRREAVRSLFRPLPGDFRTQIRSVSS